MAFLCFVYHHIKSTITLIAILNCSLDHVESEIYFIMLLLNRENSLVKICYVILLEYVV